MAIMLIEWVFTSVFLILVVLTLRAALGKRMSAGLRYGLWAVVLVRLLAPVQLFNLPVAGTWVATEKRTEQIVDNVEKFYAPNEDEILNSLGGQDRPSGAPAAFPEAPSVPDAPEPPSPPDLTKAPVWLGWAWLAGAALTVFVFLLSNLWFYRRLRRERIPLDTVDHPLRVYVAVGLPSPCLFGVFRPAVYVTPDAAADPDMLRHVLAHEYTHFRHGDHIWSLLRCAALAAHWWNPLVWLAAVLSRRDGELACDEGALKRLGDGERAAYGGTLLALVTARPRPGDLFRCATTMAGDKKSLKERVTRIAQGSKRVLWAVVVAVMVTALACVCAFGQAEPKDEPKPDPSPFPSVIAGLGETEVEIAFRNTGNDPTSSFRVPRDVLDTAKSWVMERFHAYAPDGLRTAYGGEAYQDETGKWVQEPLSDLVKFDRVRIERMEGPWLETRQGVEVEVWRVNYEFHTTTPEAAENLIVGGNYLTEGGWLCPTYPGCTYLYFQLKDGQRSLLTAAMKNDCGPDSEEEGKDRFYEVVDELLIQGKRTAVQPPAWPQTDLNRNGIPEELRLETIDEGVGQRLEIWENGALIFEEEGYFAHAGWNALFLYRDEDGGDCLLRYNPYMGQGWCDYSYQLFTLENGKETVARKNLVSFYINNDPAMSGNFDPEAIAAFMGEINALLADSVQLLNTDADLLDSFQRNGRLYDDLEWLGWWEPVYTRTGGALADQLWAFQAAMEREWYENEPVLAQVNETDAPAVFDLRYQDRSTRFTVDCADPRFVPTLRVLDWNGDGKDEIVFSLASGWGTGVLVEDLYVFDADTLEQYDTDRLNEMIFNSIESTGDEEHFYLRGAGMDEAVPKSRAREENPDVPVAEALWFGDQVRWTVKDGQVFCRLGCDASGALVNYIGWISVPVRMSPSGAFRCGQAQYMDIADSPL